MNKTEHDRFKKLLLDARLLEIQNMGIDIKEPCFEPSPEYHTKINEILTKAKENRAKTPYKYLFIVAIIVISLLVTVACAVVIDYIIKYEENATVIIPQPTKKEHRETLEDIYTMGYVPEGYTVTDVSETSKNAFAVWAKDSDVIALSQLAFTTDSIFSFDNDINYTEAHIGIYKVYYRKEFGYYDLYWKYDGYVFCLSCVENISFPEIEKIIENIKIK